jgi:putative ABC transport system permease protein
MSAVFTGQMQGMSADIIMVMPRYNMFGTQPYSTFEYVKSIEGIESASHMTTLSSDVMSSMFDGIVFAVDENFFDVYDRFQTTDEYRKAMRVRPDGVLVGKLLAEQKGFKIGDKARIKSHSMNEDGTYDWEFEVVGFYTVKVYTGDEMGIIGNYKYVDDSRVNMKGTTGYIIAKVLSPELADGISTKIDENFKNSDRATRTGAENQLAMEMVGQFGDIELVINLILSAVFFTILLVTGNTMSQAVRERTADLAVLKSIGYGDMQLFMMVMLESFIIIFTGLILGLGLTLLSIPAIVAASQGMADDAIFLSASSILLAFGIGVFVSLVSSFMPAQRALKLKVVDALAKG